MPALETEALLSTIEAIEQRRSVKHYDPTHVMPEADIQELVRLTLLSPTSFNMQNWRFVCVTDKVQQQKICEAAWNQQHVKDCSLLVVLCADLKAWANKPERYWKNAPQAVQDMIVPMIGQFYDGNEQLQRDEAMRSVGLAGQTLMLAAKAIGYDTCPMIGFDPVKVAEIVNLPDNHALGMMVTVGKASETARPRAGQLAINEVMVRNTY